MNVDAPTETTMKTTAPARSHRFGKWFAGSLIGRAWTRSGRTHKFTYRQIFTAFVVLAICGVFIRGQIHTLDTRATADEIRATQVVNYQTALVNYVDSVQTNAACLETVKRSLANREQWGVLVTDALKNGLPDIAADILHGPVLAEQPRSAADCPAILPMPIPPSGVPR